MQGGYRGDIGEISGGYRGDIGETKGSNRSHVIRRVGLGLGLGLGLRVGLGACLGGEGWGHVSVMSSGDVGEIRGRYGGDMGEIWGRYGGDIGHMSVMSRFLTRLSRGEEEAREQATLTWVGQGWG